MSVSFQGQTKLERSLRTPANANGGGILSPAKSTVTFTIKNTGAATKKVAICPASYTNPASIKDGNGNAADAIIANNMFPVIQNGNITGYEGNAYCAPRSVETTLMILRQSPYLIKAIKVIVDNEAQLEERIYYREESAFGNNADSEIVPSSYKTESQNNSKIATISDMEGLKWVFGPESLLLYNIQAGRTVQVIFLFGQGIDLTEALRNS